MNVLHVSPSISGEFGGPTHALIGYVHASIEVGIEATVAAPVYSPHEADWFLAHFPQRARLRTFAGFGRGAFRFSPKLWQWLRDNGGTFDIIHVHGLLNPVSSLAGTICRHNRWPFVVHPLGTLSEYSFSHRRTLLKRFYYRILDRPNIRSASALHFTSVPESVAAACMGVHLGSRAFAVPPPLVMPDSMSSAPAHSSPTAIFLGRLHPVKNVETLIDAWPAVLSAEPDATLIIAGDGKRSYVESLRLRCTKQGIEDRVSFLGFVTGQTKWDLLARSDVFVLPSLHENFGVAVLEALGAGLPVVITPEVQIASHVQEHQLGQVVPNEPESIADAVITHLRDRETGSYARERISATAQRLFSYRVVGDALNVMYKSARGGE